MEPAMYNEISTGTATDLRNSFLIQILILSIGITIFSAAVPANAGSIDLPNYQSGTTFVYSDGSWETVAGVSDQLVAWQDHSGKVYRRSPDFTFRSQSWKTGTRQGRRQFVPRRDSLFQKSTSLWPLKTGNKSSFSEVVTSGNIGEPEKSYRVNWSCEVTGTEQVLVMAGEFDTWKIACKRYNNFQSPIRAKVREIKTWNFAPAIGHYVLTERQYPGGKAARRLELLAVLPPMNGVSDLTRRQMDKAFHLALEFKKRNEIASWSTPKTSWSGQIMPTGTFRLADGRYSRRYVQKINYPDGLRIYYGMAVRNSSREWVIPRR